MIIVEKQIASYLQTSGLKKQPVPLFPSWVYTRFVSPKRLHIQPTTDHTSQPMPSSPRSTLTISALTIRNVRPENRHEAAELHAYPGRQRLVTRLRATVCQLHLYGFI
jgi:hypothetical protein